MEMLVGLIDSLKLDNTLFAQFFIFLVGFSFLYYMLFKPYNKAAQTRYDRTIGSEESADKYDEDIELLKRRHGQKVKETNETVSSIFAEYDTKSKKEAADLMIKAQGAYKIEKDAKEKELNTIFQKEKEKVPALTQDLKNQLKKVLAGG